MDSFVGVIWLIAVRMLGRGFNMTVIRQHADMAHQDHHQHDEKRTRQNGKPAIVAPHGKHSTRPSARVNGK